MAENKTSLKKEITKGIIKENPTLVMLLGMCPTLAVTTQAVNGIGMGLATTFVLLGSNIVISALRKVIPDKVRIPAFIVIIASFVTLIGFLLEGFVPSLYDSLGIYLTLITVNCIIFGRAEMFASKNGILASGRRSGNRPVSALLLLTRHWFPGNVLRICPRGRKLQPRGRNEATLPYLRRSRACSAIRPKNHGRAGLLWIGDRIRSTFGRYRGRFP